MPASRAAWAIATCPARAPLPAATGRRNRSDSPPDSPGPCRSGELGSSSGRASAGAGSRPRRRARSNTRRQRLMRAAARVAAGDAVFLALARVRLESRGGRWNPGGGHAVEARAELDRRLHPVRQLGCAVRSAIRGRAARDAGGEDYGRAAAAVAATATFARGLNRGQPRGLARALGATQEGEPLRLSGDRCQARRFGVLQRFEGALSRGRWSGHHWSPPGTATVNSVLLSRSSRKRNASTLRAVSSSSHSIQFSL